MYCTITLLIGTKKFDILVPQEGTTEAAESPSEGTSSEQPENEKKMIKTVGDLRSFIDENSEMDGNAVKMIFKGNFWLFLNWCV